MLDTWGQLLTLAIAVSLFALFRPNVLMAILTTGAWIALLAYHIGNQPTGITQGDTTDVALIIIFGGAMIAFPLWTLQRMRMRRMYEGKGYVFGENGNMMKGEPTATQPLSPMNMSGPEYQAYLRGRMRRGRRR